MPQATGLLVLISLPYLIGRATPESLYYRWRMAGQDNNEMAVETLDELHALYGEPVPTSITKEVDYLTSAHQQWVRESSFLVLATAGPNGLDCSPRGDQPGFVAVEDSTTILLPDRRGNNRLDSLRNIVRDPRVALLFLVPGITTTLRVNGRARILATPDLTSRFEIDGKAPATVIEVTVETAYTQCPKALIRSELWNPDLHRQPFEFPTGGQILAEITNGSFDAESHDAAYPQRIKETIY